MNKIKKIFGSNANLQLIIYSDMFYMNSWMPKINVSSIKDGFCLLSLCDKNWWSKLELSQINCDKLHCEKR
jgi:hypothetical protein